MQNAQIDRGSLKNIQWKVMPAHTQNRLDIMYHKCSMIKEVALEFIFLQFTLHWCIWKYYIRKHTCPGYFSNYVLKCTSEEVFNTCLLHFCQQFLLQRKYTIAQFYRNGKNNPKVFPVVLKWNCLFNMLIHQRWLPADYLEALERNFWAANL